MGENVSDKIERFYGQFSDILVGSSVRWPENGNGIVWDAGDSLVIPYILGAIPVDV